MGPKAGATMGPKAGTTMGPKAGATMGPKAGTTMGPKAGASTAPTRIGSPSASDDPPCCRAKALPLPSVTHYVRAYRMIRALVGLQLHLLQGKIDSQLLITAIHFY